MGYYKGFNDYLFIGVLLFEGLEIYMRILIITPVKYYVIFNTIIRTSQERVKGFKVLRGKWVGIKGNQYYTKNNFSEVKIQKYLINVI